MNNRIRRGSDDRTESGGGGYAWLFGILGLAGLLLVGFCGFGALMVMTSCAGLFKTPTTGNQPVVTVKPRPLPIDPAWNEQAMQSTYLSDLQEFDARVGWGTFGKNGLLGFDHMGTPVDRHLVQFSGQHYPKALSTHAATMSMASVKYNLGGQYKLFRGSAAMADLPANAHHQASSPVTFAIRGDGRLLWQSRPLQHRGDGEGFRLSVAGVHELELRVVCLGQANYTWSVWLDPYVMR